MPKRKDVPSRETPLESVDGWLEPVLNSKCLAIEESTPRPMPHGWEDSYQGRCQPAERAANLLIKR